MPVKKFKVGDRVVVTKKHCCMIPVGTKTTIKEYYPQGIINRSVHEWLLEGFLTDSICENDMELQEQPTETCNIESGKHCKFCEA